MSIEQAGGGTFFLLVAVALAVAVAYALYESWCLYNGRKPITGYVRQGIAAHPHWSTLIVLLVGILLGHFWR